MVMETYNEHFQRRATSDNRRVSGFAPVGRSDPNFCLRQKLQIPAGRYTQSDFGGQIQNGRRTMSQEGNERRGRRNKGADRRR
jgi:hypothetical protein